MTAKSASEKPNFLVYWFAYFILIGAYLIWIFRYFFPPLLNALIVFGALLILVVLVIAILIRLWRKFSRTELIRAIVFFMTGIALFFIDIYAPTLGSKVYLLLNRGKLESFATDIVKYGRIKKMSDGLSHFKSLNDSLVAYLPSEVRRPESEKDVFQLILPLNEVLAKEGIEPDKYEYFRQQLIDLSYIDVEVRKDVVVLTRDGMLDNCWGVLFVLSDHDPPLYGDHLSCGSLISLSKLVGRWYAFSTT